MRKIILPLFFVAFSITMNAQNTIDRTTIKSSPDQIAEFSVEDINILSKNYSQITEKQAQSLYNLFVYKYQTLSKETSEEDLVALTESMKARTRVVLGDDLYLEISQNQELFNRITGLAYLAQE